MYINYIFVFDNYLIKKMTLLSIIKMIKNIDRNTSSLIHQCVVRPRFLELLIIPFALMFNPFVVPFIAMVIGFICPRYNKSSEAIFSPPHYMVNYIVQVLVVLIFTTIGKKVLARLRPFIPVGSERYTDFRTKETNGSMPSGDTAQAALLVFFIKYNFVELYTILGEWQFALKLITLVAFGRVFYHCHFFGDTIAGALLGWAVATFFDF